MRNASFFVIVNRFPLHLKFLHTHTPNPGWKVFSLDLGKNSSNVNYFSSIISHWRSIKLEVGRDSQRPVLRGFIWSLAWTTLWQYLQKYLLCHLVSGCMAFTLTTRKDPLTLLALCGLSVTVWLHEMTWVTIYASTICMRTWLWAIPSYFPRISMLLSIFHTSVLSRLRNSENLANSRGSQAGKGHILSRS